MTGEKVTGPKKDIKLQLLRALERQLETLTTLVAQKQAIEEFDQKTLAINKSGGNMKAYIELCIYKQNPSPEIYRSIYRLKNLQHKPAPCPGMDFADTLPMPSDVMDALAIDVARGPESLQQTETPVQPGEENPEVELALKELANILEGEVSSGSPKDSASSSEVRGDLDSCGSEPQVANPTVPLEKEKANPGEPLQPASAAAKASFVDLCPAGEAAKVGWNSNISSTMGFVFFVFWMF